MVKEPVIFALTGKGGVGKTSLSSAFVRVLSEEHPDSRILAIDADPAVGLATTLGVSSGVTVDDIRNVFIQEVEEGQAAKAMELLGEARYRVEDAIVCKKNISFLAIGRPETSGCYCKVNAYLKEVISLLAKNFDYVVIDGEAGIEQVNRRVMEKVDHLILLSDASRKGIEVCRTILHVGEGMEMFASHELILNRILDVDSVKDMDLKGLNLISVIPNDVATAMADARGDSVFSWNEDDILLVKAREAMHRMLEQRGDK